jgi:signal transduction histidine kinase
MNRSFRLTDDSPFIRRAIASGREGVEVVKVVKAWSRNLGVQDLALGLALAVINVVSVLSYHAQLHPFWLALVLLAAQAVPLAWRRRWPVPVMAVTGGVRVAYDVLGFTFAPFPLGPMIAFYTVFESSGLLWRGVVGVLSATGISISLTAPGHDEPYQAIYQGLIFVTAGVAGLLSRARREALRSQTTRADRAEAELELRAARERMTIARELHDVVAHHVSLIAVQAEAAASSLPNRPAVAAKSVSIIGVTARASLTELRRILGVLRAPGSDSNGQAAPPAASLADLDALLEQVRGAGLLVELAVSGDPFPLAPGVDLTAYRIVQEALTNTIRHSAAATASVALDYEPGSVTVRVRDSGAAAPATPTARVNGSGGFGLVGIAERVASCGGYLSVGPDPGDGFTVTARLPSP